MDRAARRPLYVAASVDALARQRLAAGTKTRRRIGDIAAEAFELFARGCSVPEAVRKLRQSPALIRLLLQEFTTVSWFWANSSMAPMLQHIGSKRLIDIAKSTLRNLTSKVIPAGTPFALRVFGRRPNSCETELDIPAHPVDPAAAAKKVDGLTAKSKAKTPIAASLEKVADDLSNVSGERLVILVTDGEETCGGDPARTIQQLMKRGIDVRINILGFAVDDRKTAAMFRQWSSAGGGAYFDAKSAASLNQAFSLAVKARFEIVDVQKKVVADGLVGGEPVAVLPREYTIRLKGRSLSVTVQPQKTSNVSL